MATEGEHMARATRLVLAMMGCASTERIDPRKWWERAKSALETGAAVAGSFSQMVSVMARKLEIDVTYPGHAEAIAALAAEVDDDFDAFRRICEDQAVYAVAMAQAERQEQREQQGARV